MAWKVLLVVASILPGMVLGAWLGAQLLVPRDAGLVAGAMVLWYGLLGGLATVVAALLLVRYVAASRLRVAALFMAGVSVVLLVWLTPRFAEMGTERAEHRRQAVAMLPAFELALTGRLEPRLRRFIYTSRNNDWRIERMDGTRCQGGLPEGKAGDRARVELLSALRGLDVAGVLAVPPSCQQTGELLAVLAMTIHESRPPPTKGNLSLTTACRAEVPELAALLERVERVYRLHQQGLTCD
ncbi:cytochrome d ubiquinol oxidase subunit II [Thioalkalivibrio sp. XN8]|uniref:cytochrome d ubiquinol oxidase subunit II n=1 Tax=Thioalkalivibrio sp. XN8 TaxID=2712863 RepID=UPI0013EA7B76|nr:cytochrome d ubiquinol oxidase subunit II [Thioalkalivibrio sp. XN8]NGP54452.1 cytochrome d ubiquinol oxidase subunit II [Thioalkalivibrio sp. XN8]